METQDDDTSDDSDDLSKLSHLDDSAMLHCLQNRYLKRKFYTFLGDILVSINPNRPLLIYNDKFHDIYTAWPVTTKPHIFWIARQAFIELIETRKSQSILVGGESGSGKTENTKLLLRHIAHVSSSKKNNLHEKIVQINPLLESFGNAKTCLNKNSSRFGKCISLKFDGDGVLSSAFIQHYLFEKTRVTSGVPGEQNFHIFYYLLNGPLMYQRDSYGLDMYDSFRILNIDDRTGDHEDGMYNKLEEQIGLMKIIGFNQQEISFILSLLVSVLHVAQLNFKRNEDDTLGIDNMASLHIVCNLLEIDCHGFFKALVYNTVYIRGETVQCMKTLTKANSERDAFAKYLYSQLFEWIVRQINSRLMDSLGESSGTDVCLLDMAGFENLPKNGFEQLCINSANERMQQYMNERLFAQEEADYIDEGIAVNPVEYQSNDETAEFLFKKPLGLFNVIDEETKFPSSSDTSLKLKLDHISSDSNCYTSSRDNLSFTLNHYAGEVEYHVDGMLERNSDRLSNDFVQCLSDSKNHLVTDLNDLSDKLSTKWNSQLHLSSSEDTLSELSYSTFERKRNYPKPRYSNTGSESRQPKFVSGHFRRSLSDQMNKLTDTKPWFVRCVKPNENQAPDQFDGRTVGNQLKNNGMLEIAKIRKHGYALRLTPSDFLQRYRDISFERKEDIKSTFDNCEKVLIDAKISGYAFGKQKIFLRHWHGQLLQGLASEARAKMADKPEPVDNPETMESTLNNTSVETGSLNFPPIDNSKTFQSERKFSACLKTNTGASSTTSIETVTNSASNPFPYKTYTGQHSGMVKEIGAGNVYSETSGKQFFCDDTTCDDTSTMKSAPKRTESCTSASSQQRVAEWMQNNENLSDDTFDPGPPPLFPKPQRNQHVRISLPEYSETKVLDERLWDRFQMIPRERISTSDTMRPVVKMFKFLCYILMFSIVLASAVVSKMCILLLTSSIIKDPMTKNDADSPANTMLVIVICSPYMFWVISYSAKSLFGSSAWPSFKMIVITLFLELLHTFGLSLIVFHILPRMDMARGVLVLCGVSTVPAFFKTICIACDSSTPRVKRCTLAFISSLAFLIQLANLPASTLFATPLSETEKNTLKASVLNNEDILHSVSRPALTFGDRTMWEIPVALFFISVSYWENFVSGNFSIGSFTIPLLDWKKRMHSVRQRLYIFAGVWKIGWTMVFAVLLLPGFTFNLSFTEPSEAVPAKVTAIDSLSTTPAAQSTTMGSNFTHNPTTTYAAPTLPGYEGTGRNLRIKRSIADDIQKHGVNAVSNLSSDTLNEQNQQYFGESATIQPLLENEDIISTPETERKTSKSQNKTSSTFYLTIPESLKLNFQQYGPLYLHLIASTLMSYFGSLACKLCMQTFGFTLPLFLATPVTFGIILAQSYTQFIPSYFYVWICPEMDGNIRFFHLLWLGVLWCSQVIVTAHIWSPKNGRMAKIDRLFVQPIRCGVLLDHGMMLRRRTNDRDFSLFNTDDNESFFLDDEDEVHKADDVVPQIYACATMWHETRSEMTQLLKSLFRMDIDHSARYLAQKYYDIKDPDYYEFEAHIFFDDAMELSDDDLLVPNSFVADMIDCIEDALSSVHERQMYIGPPVRMPTPYGGRLIWRLPGGTKILVHLKDKHKVRHKKRWSQVMYMYYLLGYRILAQPDNLMKREGEKDKHADSDESRVKLTETQLRRRRQASHFTRSVIFNYTSEEVHTQAENTFILSLDGDVDFKPDAVRLLVDRLKKNKKVGAACGRIHPVGSGPILWYQEFEYAIGHWLQKATEHVFGCVLCAPGCFSLFRGSAIMDDNVARSYAIRTTEAGQYVQYDQGEDRWLSTLLLQQGYRIDYCAAADALTHAPETFSEFFNQRRRWGPSTLANICDLLGDWKNTVRLNDNISTPYVLYQFLLLVSTILGPATVLLMMAGAFTVVFKTTIVESYAISLIPAIFFILVCVLTKPSTQLTVATIMSACYAIVMTIVLVGTVGTGIEGGLTSPNVIFLVLLVFIFFLSALFHPEEFACLIPGAMYFICIPTGYLVLTIYYLCNLHIVSWGTREVPKRKTREEIEEEKMAEEEKRKKKESRKGFLGFLGLETVLNEAVELFRQFRKSASTENNVIKPKTDDLLQQLIEEMRHNRGVDCKMPIPRPRSSLTLDEAKPALPPKPATPSLPQHLPVIRTGSVGLRNEDPGNPGWLSSMVCGDGPIKIMSERERIFWRQLIKKYLFPINEDKVHQEKVAADLKNLRNNVVFGFFMSSALWIALTMQLQLLQDEFKDTILFIKIPNFDPSRKDLTFEPLGMLFLALFATILIFQFIGMLSHRWGTILHVLSITDISCTQQFTEKHKIQEIITKTLELQRVINIENEPEPDYEEGYADYEGDELEDEDDFSSSLFTDSSGSSLSISRPPPSYHSQDITNGRKCIRRRQSAIFNRRGYITGRTLRHAFERRFRNELQRRTSCESVNVDNGQETNNRFDTISNISV